MKFHRNVLDYDIESEVNRITKWIKHTTSCILRKRGLVVAVSGGIDSSLTAALAIRSIGPKRVITLSLPEWESNPLSTDLGKVLADHLGIERIVEQIGPTLEALGCYQRRDEAIKSIFPEYDSTYKIKIVLPPNLKETGRLNIYSLIIESPDGRQQSKRLPTDVLLNIVAATNHKQRTRTQYQYYHADRLNYAVSGTSNRLEVDQGFFVKGGDGLADIKPIAHLYKTQVYKMAGFLGLPDEIVSQEPTPDTYSLGSSSEEFYFGLPYKELDLFLWALNHKIPQPEVAEEMGYTIEQVGRIFEDIRQKRRSTYYLHPTLYINPIEEICPYKPEYKELL